MIKLGNNNIGKIYLGSNSIGKAYYGSDLVFQKGSSPTPPGPPVGVVFYDCLVFDGTAYIDTDIIPPTDASFRVRLGDETVKAVQRCFGLTATSGTIAMHYSTSTNSTTRAFNVYYGDSNGFVWSGPANSFSTTRYRFILTPNLVGWGENTTHTFTKGSGTPSGPITFGTNTGHSGQAYTGIMETFQIYGSDAQNVTTYDGFGSYTPVYTLRPCTYNGEAGFWCVETSTFYGNTAGSGTLTVQNNS